MKTSMAMRPNLFLGVLELLFAIFLILIPKENGFFGILLWIMPAYFLLSVISTILRLILKKPLIRREDNLLIVKDVLFTRKIGLEGLIIKKVKLFGMSYLILKSKNIRISFSQFSFKKADIIELERFIKDFYV